MSAPKRKQAIESALKAFISQPLYQAGMGLLDSLGYRSDLTLRLSGLKAFRDTLDQQGRLRDDAAKTSEWVGVEFLRQITGEDISSSAQGTIPFQQQFSPTEMQSYVFVAVELKRDSYTRTELSQITRAVNRVFDMPAMLLFKYGTGLTLAVIRRRPNKRDDTRDVPDKVTLVKDISYADPLRAHIEILHDLSLEALYEEFYFHNFVGLHQAWENRLASYELNKRFYREVANWYFWALKAPGVVLPRSIEAIHDTEEREKQRSIFFIRLLTRLIFCWFLQEKGLLPRDLFRPRVAEELLKDTSPAAGTYYKAFLQNLFFATLNQEQERRGWRRKYQGSRDGNRGVTNLWRYQDLLTSPDKLEALLRDRIPFVNGGLFDCLDDTLETANVRLDDFSEEKDNRLCLPNELFFGEERPVDLSAVYEDARRKKERVSGLIDILSRYKFTVEEKTPAGGGGRPRPRAVGRGVREPSGLLQRGHAYHRPQGSRRLLHPSGNCQLHGR
jgi:adenine-specific DNA-methyltransferase